MEMEEGEKSRSGTVEMPVGEHSDVVEAEARCLYQTFQP
jgi:hypothetical protein